MNSSAVSPQNLIWPCWNFSTRCLAPVILPLSTTRQPRAPASIICCAVPCPARRKNQPRSSELARRLAIIWALRRGSVISSTSRWGRSILKSFLRRLPNSWMTLPRRPITLPTCSANRLILVPSGVRVKVRPPKPARSVSLSRNSRTSWRSTLRLMSFLMVLCCSAIISPQNTSSPSPAPKCSRKISRLTW